MDTPQHSTDERQHARSRLRSDYGLEAVEFALIAALVVAILVAALPTLQDSITGVYTSVMETINGAGTSP